MRVANDMRSAPGVVHLADKYDAERHNAACRRAIDVGDSSYKTAKESLSFGIEHDGEDVPASAPPAPAHLRGRAALFGFGGGRVKTHQLEDGLRTLRPFGRRPSRPVWPRPTPASSATSNCSR